MDRPLIDVPILIAQTGPLDGLRWPIDIEIHIGRDPECNIVIPDRQVSRFHTRIFREENNVILEDLASKNGTFLNGKQITKPEKLQDGDFLQVALVQKFTFLSSDATMPLDQQFSDLQQPAQKQKKSRIKIDSKARRVWILNEEMIPPLSVPQFLLLKTLFDHQGEVVSRSDLVFAVWGSDRAVGVSEQALDALIRRLRERINLMDDTQEYITTVRGHGIRLENI
jgi:hypothetical protein